MTNNDVMNLIQTLGLPDDVVGFSQETENLFRLFLQVKGAADAIADNYPDLAKNLYDCAEDLHHLAVDSF